MKDQRKKYITVDIMEMVRDLLDVEIKSDHWCMRDAELLEILARQIRKSKQINMKLDG